MVVEIEHDDREVVVTAQGHRRDVHHPQITPDDLVIGDIRDEFGRRIAGGVRAVDTFDLGGLDDHIRIHLDRPQNRRGVRGEIGIPGTPGEDDDSSLLHVTKGPAPDVRLGQLRHSDRRHDTGFDRLLLEQILHRQRIHDGGEHPHVVRGTLSIPR